MEHKKLPEDFKKLWIEALRSGKYKQGVGGLLSSDNERYCCLGVAAHVGKVDINYFYSYIPDDCPGVPEELSNDFDLQKKLADMNDGGASFHKIADWIEENL